MRLERIFHPKLDIPEGFYLLVDTREKLPLFDDDEPFVIRKPLKIGDYSIKGFENEIAIERKSISDLYLCLGKERERFMKEINLMRHLKWKGLLIEAKEEEIYAYFGGPTLHPNAIYSSLASLEVKAGFHIYYADTLKQAKFWVLSRLLKYYKHKRNGTYETPLK